MLIFLASLWLRFRDKRMLDTTIKQMPKYDSYKDSGVQWLGVVPEHWSTERSQWLFQQRVEKATKQDVQLTASQKYGMISQDEFIRLEGRKVTQVFLNPEILKHIEANDFVISMRSFQGGIEYSELTGCVSSAYVPLIPSDLVHSRYFKYLFKSQRYIEALQSTSNLVRDGQALRFDNFRMIDLPVIPLVEQKAIANFLDKKITQIDEAIAIKQKQIELLKERKQIIIQQAVTQGLNPDAPMKDSGVDWIGEIPEHWNVKRLKYVLEERNERSKTGEEPLFMVSQVHGLVVRADFHEKAEVAASNIDNKIVYKNDLVFNKLKAHLGVFFKSNIDFKGLVSPDYAVYKSKAYISDIKILELLFRHPSYIEQFVIRATGIVEGLIRLYTSELFDIAVPIAPENEQRDIISFVESQGLKHDQAIAIQVQQIEKLKEYKTTLINSAVTGKIKVTDLA